MQLWHDELGSHILIQAPAWAQSLLCLYCLLAIWQQMLDHGIIMLASQLIPALEILLLRLKVWSWINAKRCAGALFIIVINIRV